MDRIRGWPIWRSAHHHCFVLGRRDWRRQLIVRTIAFTWSPAQEGRTFLLTINILRALKAPVKLLRHPGSPRLFPTRTIVKHVCSSCRNAQLTQFQRSCLLEGHQPSQPCARRSLHPCTKNKQITGGSPPKWADSVSTSGTLKLLRRQRGFGCVYKKRQEKG